MGTPDFAVPSLEALAGKHEVVAVFTQPPRPAGRGKRERPTAVHQRALELGLSVCHPTTLKHEAEKFAALSPEVAVVVAYGLLLPQAILGAPVYGCLNIHASLLPRWRGAAPIHRAVMAGDDETGISIMQMDEGLDTGPVLLTRSTGIDEDETAGMLHDRLAVLGANAILEALDNLDHLDRVPQPSHGVTYAHKIDKSEAAIDWTQSAEVVARQIRGLSPFPGAYAVANGERIKLLSAKVAKGEANAGEVISGFTVACGSGAVEITKVQRAGKKPMTAVEFLRGHSLPSILE